LVAFFVLALILRRQEIADRRERTERTFALLWASITIPIMLANLLSGTGGYRPGHPRATQPEFWLPPTLLFIAFGIGMLVFALWPRTRR
jgi:hypothetical protein